MSMCGNSDRRIEKKGQKESFFILLVFLGICVIASMALLAHHLSNFISVDHDEIALVPARAETKIKVSRDTENGGDEGEPRRGEIETKISRDTLSGTFSASKAISSEQRTSGNPGFEAYDEKTVWSTKTKVDIFSASYKNNQGILTVESEKNDKVIAPGTEDRYTFWLKNTGDVPVNYTLEFEALFSPENVKIPVKAKIKSYNGEWLLGGKDRWTDVLKLNSVEDRATLGVNQYAKYALDWQWVFERGYDLYDTYLGNRAVNEDLSLTIIIKTVAEADTGTSIADNSSSTQTNISNNSSTQTDISNHSSSVREDEDEDVSLPQFITADQIPTTGDIWDMAFYIILAVASILGISLLLLQKRKAKETEK